MLRSAVGQPTRQLPSPHMNTTEGLACSARQETEGSGGGASASGGSPGRRQWGGPPPPRAPLQQAQRSRPGSAKQQQVGRQHRATCHELYGDGQTLALLHRQTLAACRQTQRRRSQLKPGFPLPTWLPLFWAAKRVLFPACCLRQPRCCRQQAALFQAGWRWPRQDVEGPGRGRAPAAARTCVPHDAALQRGQVHHVQRVLHHLQHLLGRGPPRAGGVRGLQPQAALTVVQPSAAEPRLGSSRTVVSAWAWQARHGMAGRPAGPAHLLPGDVLGEAQTGGKGQRLAHRGAGRVHVLAGGRMGGWGGVGWGALAGGSGRPARIQNHVMALPRAPRHAVPATLVQACPGAHAPAWTLLPDATPAGYARTCCST